MPKFGMSTTPHTNPENATQRSKIAVRSTAVQIEKDEYPCDFDGKDVQERIAGAPSEIMSFNLWGRLGSALEAGCS